MALSPNAVDRRDGLSEILNPRPGYNRLTGARVIVDNRILRDAPDVYAEGEPPVESAPVDSSPAE